MRMMNRFLLILCLISASPVFGHEFWIAPYKFQVEPGDEVIADLRVGQNFAGSAFAFIPNNFERFDYISNDQTKPVAGRLGDRPALKMSVAEPGLLILVHETTDNDLTYRDWEKFERFVAHKKLAGTIELHQANGWPRDEFVERYRRYAKSLIAVGAGNGSDRAVGLKTEIVALQNPYVDDVLGGVPVAVLFDGEPRPYAQIEVFEKTDATEATIFTLQTDENGHATIPVKAGHKYMLDAVKMLALSPLDPTTEPVWYSLWASLTFRIPN